MTLTTTQQQDNTIEEINAVQNICSKLMKFPHYAKLGDAGIFAVVQKARSINMDVMYALDEGLYFVNGKVEMKGQAMLALIRQAGHSVSMDPKSTNEHVIMRGKRVDNGDMWTVEFSIQDAKRGGFYRGQWEKMPKDMCTWRCVSKLGRFLFSDVIKGCYVEGEIRDAVPFDAKVIQPVLEPSIDLIKDEQAVILEILFDELDDLTKEKIKVQIFNRYKVNSFSELPADCYEKLKDHLSSLSSLQIVKNEQPKIEEEENEQSTVNVG
jgi:hypothetical protein